VKRQVFVKGADMNLASNVPDAKNMNAGKENNNRQSGGLDQLEHRSAFELLLFFNRSKTENEPNALTSCGY
jgi:hypothetical protein